MSKTNILVLLLVIYCCLAHIVTPQPPTKPNYFDESCDDFVEDSDHLSNLRTLMIELKNKAYTTFFYNSSFGSGNDKVYGQYYCRADIDSDLCGQCIDEAANSSCIGGRYGTVTYEECTLSYDHQSMFGKYDPGITFFSKGSPFMVTDSEKFGTVLNSTLKRIISEMGNHNASLFATGEAVVSESETVYCLVQCSPDLNLTQCNSCLSLAHSACDTFANDGINMSEDWQRKMSVFGKRYCQLQYSNYGAFYRLIPAPGPALSPGLSLVPPSSDVPHVTKDKG